MVKIVIITVVVLLSVLTASAVPEKDSFNLFMALVTGSFEINPIDQDRSGVTTTKKGASTQPSVGSDATKGAAPSLESEAAKFATKDHEALKKAYSKLNDKHKAAIDSDEDTRKAFILYVVNPVLMPVGRAISDFDDLIDSFKKDFERIFNPRLGEDSAWPPSLRTAHNIVFNLPTIDLVRTVYVQSNHSSFEFTAKSLFDLAEANCNEYKCIAKALLGDNKFLDRKTFETIEKNKPTLASKLDAIEYDDLMPVTGNDSVIKSYLWDALNEDIAFPLRGYPLEPLAMTLIEEEHCNPKEILLKVYGDDLSDILGILYRYFDNRLDFELLEIYREELDRLLKDYITAPEKKLTEYIGATGSLSLIKTLIKQHVPSSSLSDGILSRIDAGSEDEVRNAVKDNTLAARYMAQELIKDVLGNEPTDEQLINKVSGLIASGDQTTLHLLFDSKKSLFRKTLLVAVGLPFFNMNLHRFVPLRMWDWDWDNLNLIERAVKKFREHYSISSDVALYSYLSKEKKWIIDRLVEHLKSRDWKDELTLETLSEILGDLPKDEHLTNLVNDYSLSFGCNVQAKDVGGTLFKVLELIEKSCSTMWTTQIYEKLEPIFGEKIKKPMIANLEPNTIADIGRKLKLQHHEAPILLSIRDPKMYPISHPGFIIQTMLDIGRYPIMKSSELLAKVPEQLVKYLQEGGQRSFPRYLAETDANLVQKLWDKYPIPNYIDGEEIKDVIKLFQDETKPLLKMVIDGLHLPDGFKDKYGPLIEGDVKQMESQGLEEINQEELARKKFIVDICTKDLDIVKLFRSADGAKLNGEKDKLMDKFVVERIRDSNVTDDGEKHLIEGFYDHISQSGWEVTWTRESLIKIFTPLMELNMSKYREFFEQKMRCIFPMGSKPSDYGADVHSILNGIYDFCAKQRAGHLHEPII